MKSRTGKVVVIGSVFALLTCTVAVQAEIEAKLRVNVVDSAGADLTSAVVARVTDSGKLEAGKRLDKSTWVFEAVKGKVVLSVRDGRDGGIVEILIPAKTPEVAFEVQVIGTVVRAEVVGNTTEVEQLRTESGFQLSRPGPCTADFAVVAPYISPTRSTCGAVDDCDVTASDNEDHIYEVTIPNAGDWTFSLCGSSYDTKLMIGTICCGSDVGYNDDACPGFRSELTVNIAAGTYYVVVDGFGSNCGDYVLEISKGPGCTADFSVVAPYTSPTRNTCGAVDDCDVTFSDNEDHIYEVTIPNAGDWTFSLCGSAYDTKLMVGSTCCGDEVGYNDDSCGAQSEITVNIAAGTYYVVVDGFSSSCGDYVLDISKSTPPPCTADFSVVAPYTSPTRNTCGAVDDCDVTFSDNEDHIYDVTIPNDGLWTFSLCGSSYDTKLMIGTTCCGDEVGYNDDACPGFRSELVVNIVAGTYYVVVDGFGSNCGDYVLEISKAPPPPGCGGDTCAAPLAIGSVPFNDTGNTCACTDDYDEICNFNTPGSPDNVYAYTPIADECVDITLCNGSTYDTKLYVYAGSCSAYQSGVYHACNDDACPGFVSELTGVNLTGGTTYYIVIDGYDGDCGDYVLDITPCAGPCDVVCDAAKTAENEPNCGLPTDTVNGGCNSDPVNPPTSIIACGQEYCGTAAFDGATRDTDWYEVTVAGPTRFTWTVTAEFDSLTGLVETIPPGSPNCADSTGFLSPFGLAGPCEVSAVVTDCLPAGTYRFFAAPDFAALVTCGAEYNARLDCEVCTVPTGACCPGDGSCVPDQTESACVGSGGSWLGDGSTCSPNLCPQPPSNDLCDNAIAVAVPSTTAGSTDAATIDSAFPFCETGITSPGVWYSVTGTGNTMTASTCNDAAYDTKISVYCPDCATATCVDGNDDGPGCAGFTSLVSWCSQAGQTYLILVHGFGGQSGSFNLTVSDNGVGCADPPPCAICGEPGAGDCCVANGSVGCDDLACCELVCACDSFCCDTDWDENCAGPNAFVPGCSALDLCAVCQPTGACCVGLNCSVLTEADCTIAGGTYLGDGSDCSGQGGGNPTVYAADPNAAIPDGDTVTGVSHTITVPDSFTIGDVDVDVVITHTWTGDLRIDVEHLGTTVTIVNQPGDGSDTPGSPFGCSADNYDIILDDEGGGGAIEAQCSANLSSPPNYTPNNPLSAFDGLGSAGDWTITVFDTAGFDTGTLDHWSLHIDSPGPNPCIPTGACCNWPDTCEIRTQDDCEAGGGIYLGDDTSCGGGGAVTIVNAMGLGLAIPDDGFPASGATHTLNVADSFNLLDVDIDVQISHTWTGDLVIEVEHLGTTARIVNQPGDGTDTPGSPFGCSADNYDIILDDEGAGGAIEAQCSANLSSPPNYTPNDALSVFDGMPSAGNWTITVFDTAGFDTGTLDGWSVHMEGPAGPGPCEGVFPGACCDGNTGVCTDDVAEANCVGDQLEWYKNTSCTAINCVQHTGACCDGNTGLCVNDVLPGDCVGDQQSWSKNTACSAIVCDQHTGACCDGNTGLCADDVLPGDCVGDQQSWSKNTACSAVNCLQHTGACCDEITGTCTDDVLPGDCIAAFETWTKGASCASVVCEATPVTGIPTVSAWGVAILTLLLLVFAKVYFRPGKDPAGA